MKHSLFIVMLLLPLALPAQDFLQPASWCGNDTTLPLADYYKRYDCWDGHHHQGILAWRNDSIFFAEFHHYEFVEMHQLSVPLQWVLMLDELAEAAIRTTSHFYGDITGASLAYLYHYCGAARLDSPQYGRALELSRIFDSIIVAVMDGDTVLMRRQVTVASHLGRSFRSDYPMVCFRPSIGISYSETHDGGPLWSGDDEHWKKRHAWLKPLCKQHDLFGGVSSTCCEPGMFLDGTYLCVYQQCDREVDSAMIVGFALDRREEFTLLSRILCIEGYHPKVVITLSDTVTQRRCYIDAYRCRMLLPSTDRLSNVTVPQGRGIFIYTSAGEWARLDENEFYRWWQW